MNNLKRNKENAAISIRQLIRNLSNPKQFLKNISKKKISAQLQISIELRDAIASEFLFRCCRCNSISIAVLQCLWHSIKLFNFVKLVIRQHLMIAKILFETLSSQIYSNSIARELLGCALQSHDLTICWQWLLGFALVSKVT